MGADWSSDVAAGSSLIALAACVVGPDGVQRRVADGGVVYPADQISFAIRTARTAHVQLLQHQHGKLTRLWPLSDQPATAWPSDRVLHIPDAKYRFVLDDDTGPFSIFVVASDGVLPNSEAALTRVLSGAAQEGGMTAASGVVAKRERQSRFETAHAAKVPPKSRVRQTLLQADPLHERGIVVESKATGAVVATPDPQGIAIIEFRLNHKPRPR